MGKPTQTRGGGLPAASAESVNRGTTWSPQSVGAGHPSDGAVGEATGDLEHPGAEGGHQHGNDDRVGVRDLQFTGDLKFLAMEVDTALAKEGTQHRQVFLDVPGGTGVGQTEPVFDGGAVGNANAEGEPSADGDLGGEGLLGHGDGVPREGGNDRGAQLNAAGLHAGHGDDGEHICAEVLREPVAVESLSFGVGDAVKALGDIPHQLEGATNSPIRMAGASRGGVSSRIVPRLPGRRA